MNNEYNGAPRDVLSNKLLDVPYTGASILRSRDALSAH